MDGESSERLLLDCERACLPTHEQLLTKDGQSASIFMHHGFFSAPRLVQSVRRASPRSEALRCLASPGSNVVHFGAALGALGAPGAGGSVRRPAHWAKALEVLKRAEDLGLELWIGLGGKKFLSLTRRPMGLVISSIHWGG